MKTIHPNDTEMINQVALMLFNTKKIRRGTTTARTHASLTKHIESHFSASGWAFPSNKLMSKIIKAFNLMMEQNFTPRQKRNLV